MQRTLPQLLYWIGLTASSLKFSPCPALQMTWLINCQMSVCKLRTLLPIVISKFGQWHL